MIRTENLSKKFGDFTALKDVSCSISKGSIYGMVGSNGAGKSTFLRLINGVYTPDSGSISINGEPVYENPKIKEIISYVPDTLYFLPGASMNRMAKLYAAAYDKFDFHRFETLTKAFELNPKANIHSFSKGMKRQAAIILSLSCRPEYLFFDETFDGLDPVMRNLVKSLICKDVLEKESTAIITSHSLRELEDICDHVGLLHKGGVLLSKDLEDMKCNIQKIQCVFKTLEDEAKVISSLDIMKNEKRGSLNVLTVRGNKAEILAIFATANTVFFEALPLSLEEIFISETEVVGYDIKKLILG